MFKIFIFTLTDTEGWVTFSQIYGKNRIMAMADLELIYGQLEGEIGYINQEVTTMPLDWSDESEYILNN